jgi:hypothetical protein
MVSFSPTFSSRLIDITFFETYGRRERGMTIDLQRGLGQDFSCIKPRLASAERETNKTTSFYLEKTMDPPFLQLNPTCPQCYNSGMARFFFIVGQI